MNASILDAAGDVARCLLDELAGDGVRADSIELLGVLARFHTQLTMAPDRATASFAAGAAFMMAGQITAETMRKYEGHHRRLLAAMRAVVVGAMTAELDEFRALLAVLARLHRELESPDGLTADSGQDLVALSTGRWPLEELAPADVVQHAFGGARRDAAGPVDAVGAAAGVGGSTSTVPHPSPAVVVAGGPDRNHIPDPDRSTGAGDGSPVSRRSR